MAHFAVTAAGADRPGIVAAVTEPFVELGANLEDSSMTILRGQFAMMLVVDIPGDVQAGELEVALNQPARELDLVVTVRRAPLRSVDDSADADRWTVSVHGSDHPGIVHGVTALLAALSVNIVDLTTRMVGRADAPVYAIVLDVTLPAGVDPAALDQRLQARAAELGVTCRLHSSDGHIL